MLAKEANTNDLRVRRTRLLLKEKFWELLAEQGFFAITVQDITDRAMVNRATFYDHFADKYSLLQYGIHDWFQKTLDEELVSSSDPADVCINNLLKTTCEYLAKLRYHCLPRDNAILPFVQTTITDLIADVLIASMNKEKDPKMAKLSSTITSWAIYGAAFYWCQFEKQEKVEDFVVRVLPNIQSTMN